MHKKTASALGDDKNSPQIGLVKQAVMVEIGEDENWRVGKNGVVRPRTSTIPVRFP